MTAVMVSSGAHLTALPGGGWKLWRDALLRGAGFPADGLLPFAAPECAAAADRLLSGAGAEAEFAAVLKAAQEATGRAVFDIASDPRFREAVIWQNPGAADAAAGVVRDGPLAPRNARRRRREEIIAKYWQRYCAKNDTIGYFGPICWVKLDPSAPAMTLKPGPDRVRDRTVHLEWWALDAVAQTLAADPEVRRWLPPVGEPHGWLDGTTWRWPHRPPVGLSAPEAAVLARCDGSTPAQHVAVQVSAERPELRRPEDVLLLLGQLARRGLVRWDADLPLTLAAERTLLGRLAAIDDAPVRERATAAVQRLLAARDRVAAAVGPESLVEAVAGLEETFVELTGREPRQRGGQTYAGRTLVHLEAVRDVEITLGGPVLAALAPLDLLLRSARWLTGAIADTYAAALGELYAELAADTGDPVVPFGQLWYLAQAAVFGADPPATAVVEDFSARWRAIFGLAERTPDVRRLDLHGADLEPAIERLFPQAAPGWALARVHSPDVHLLADGPEAFARGEFTAVLGELHLGFAALDTDFFRLGHGDPDAFAAALTADVGTARLHPLLPAEWPRHCARNADWMHGPDDVELGFASAPGADRDRLLPVSALTVRSGASAEGSASVPAPEGAGLVVSAPDGRRWPLIEVFAGMLALLAFDTWKLAGGQAHTPRISLDGLVVVRETWRTTVSATGLAEARGEAERYLAVRRWRQELGLPERVFLRVGTEVKPCYVDLTSPVFVRILCTMVRSARAAGGDDVSLVVSELLPAPEHAWLVDAEGRRYCSELRLQVVDPAGSA